MRLIALLLAVATPVVFAANPPTAPDVDAVLEANRLATGPDTSDGKHAVEVIYDYSGQGMTGTVSSVYDPTTGDFVDSSVIGPTTGLNGFDGREAWMKDMSGAIIPEAGGDNRQLAVNEAYQDANWWMRPDRGGALITSLGVKTKGESSFDVLSITPKDGKQFEAWFDTRTHLLVQTVSPQGSEVITTSFSDYRPMLGMLTAGKQVADDGNGVQYEQTQTAKSMRYIDARPASAYAAPVMSRANAHIDNASGITSVPFQLLNNHIYAEVKVNGKGPFLCIFDTGGQDLLTPATAKALSVSSEGKSAGTGSGEGVVDTSFASGVSFQIGDLVMNDRAITVLPFEADQVEGLNEQGMIGFAVFRRFVTVVDYGKHVLTFIDPKKFDPRDAGTPVPFVFYDFLPQVQGTFEGLPARYDIDTGSRSELTLTKPFVEANHLTASHAHGVIAVDGWGVGGRAVSYVTRATGVTLGPVKVDDLVVGFGTQGKGAFSDPNYEGNIGSGLLKRFVVTFDYEHQIMYLKPLPTPVADIGTFDRAGFWINTSAKGFEIVDLTAGGAAESAGLKKGDQITSVDGKPAGQIAISDLRQQLRNRPVGTKVTLGVETAGQARSVVLTLKDQI